MNREHEFPSNRMHEPDSPESPARLDEIERRLKQARPCMPKLDMVALQRLANEPTAATPIETPMAAVIHGRLPQRSHRLSRRMTALAGSWVCGAMAGTLATFILMTHTAPPPDATSETAQFDEGLPTSVASHADTAPDTGQQVEPTTSPPSEEKADPLGVESAVLAMIFDPLGSEDSSYWATGSTLRAGTHLGRRARNSSAFVDRTTDAARGVRGDARPRRTERPKGSAPYPEPASATTRKRLMRDLLGKPPGLVL